MTTEEVEELQRKQLQQLLEQEELLAREKSLKEGTVKYHYDQQRERHLENLEKAKRSPGKGKMGALRTRKQTDHFGVPVSSTIPFCLEKEATRGPKRPVSAVKSPPKPEEPEQGDVIQKPEGGTRRRDPKAEYAELHARRLAYKAKKHLQNKKSDSESSS